MTHKFQWGNASKIENLFNVPASTLKRWTVDKPERCELLEEGLKAYEWFQSAYPMLISNNISEDILESEIALLGFNAGTSKTCQLLPTRHQWAMRQAERNPQLLFGLILGLSQVAINETKATHPDVNTDTAEKRAFITGLHYTHPARLEAALQIMRRSH